MNSQAQVEYQLTDAERRRLNRWLSRPSYEERKRRKEEREREKKKQIARAIEIVRPIAERMAIEIFGQPHETLDLESRFYIGDILLKILDEKFPYRRK